MSSMLKTAGAVCFVAAACFGASLYAQSANIFWQDSWDSGVTAGCDFTKLTDNRAWDDYGPGSSCSEQPPVAEIVTNDRVNGSAALRVNFEPDGSGNGPDFRIVKAFGTNRNEIYARWYTKWSNNWRFAGGDHKVAIFGIGSQGSQDVYYNIRGSNSPTGRVTIHVIPSDVAFSDRNFTVTPGVWHLCEIHIVSGSNGRVEAKMDGQLLNLTVEAGQNRNPNNLNTGGGVGYIKLDTTYNVYSYPSGLGLHMQMFYDAVAVGTGGWIGPIGGGGSAPTTPTNLRIVGN
jgi:hypothetical protein